MCIKLSWFWTDILCISLCDVHASRNSLLCFHYLLHFTLCMIICHFNLWCRLLSYIWYSLLFSNFSCEIVQVLEGDLSRHMCSDFTIYLCSMAWCRTLAWCTLVVIYFRIIHRMNVLDIVSDLVFFVDASSLEYHRVS